MAVVTVSRLQGSGGDEIAVKIAEELKYGLVDTGLILEVAKRAGVSVDKARCFDEKFHSRTVEWLKSLISPRIGKILVDEGKKLDPKTFVDYAKTIILGLSEKRKIVIVGRASQFILKNVDHAFHVRIIADEEFRVKRIKEHYAISERDALEIIKKSDSMRKNYIERYFNEDWDNKQAYHLIINASKLGIDEAAHLIIEAVKQFSASHEFVPGIRDRRSEGRRKGEERRKHDRRSGVGLWTQRDTQRAIIQGRPVRSYSKPDRRKGERRKGSRR